MTILLNLIFLGASIWISQRAQPLGQLPYRWGVYVGLTAAWMSLWLMVSAAQAFYDRMPGGPVLCLTAVVAAISSLGILRRRKFGVVAFGLSYTMLILMLPFIESTGRQPFALAIRSKGYSVDELARRAMSFPALASILSGALFLVFTFVYFKERWQLLRSSTKWL